MLSELICDAVQVFRYSALLFGVLYGVYHQSTITAKTKLAQIDREYSHKESLILQAKAEFAKKNMPAESKTEGDGSKYNVVFLYQVAGTWRRAVQGSAIKPLTTASASSRSNTDNLLL